MAANLTKKQKQLLDFIEKFISDCGYSPTYREIMAGLGYKSVATVAKHIDNLVILGFLQKSDSGEARSVCLSKNQFSDEKIVVAVEILRQKSSFLRSNGRDREAEILDLAREIIES